MEKKWYGILIDGSYVVERNKDNKIIIDRDGFGQFQVDEDYDKVRRWGKVVKERFPEHQVEIGVLTLHLFT